MDHFAEKGDVFEFQCGLAHNPITIKAAIKIPEATAAAD